MYTLIGRIFLSLYLTGAGNEISLLLNTSFFEGLCLSRKSIYYSSCLGFGCWFFYLFSPLFTLFFCNFIPLNSSYQGSVPFILSLVALIKSVGVLSEKANWDSPSPIWVEGSPSEYWVKSLFAIDKLDSSRNAGLSRTDRSIFDYSLFSVIFSILSSLKWLLCWRFKSRLKSSTNLFPCKFMF